MKTFDVSVNLLTDNLLWIQNRESKVAGRSTQEPLTPLKPPPQQPPTHGEQSVSGALSTCSRAPQVPLDIAILLLLPGTFMLVFGLLISSPEDNESARDRISTLVACAVLLSTPAVLTVWNPRTSGKRPLLVHMLLLHATALLAVLRPENIWGVSVVWVSVFMHLGFQLPARRWLCFLLMSMNVANVLLLLVTNEREETLDTHGWGHFSAVLFNAGVVLASAAGYAYCYILLC
jgi:hypothetical protein